MKTNIYRVVSQGDVAYIASQKAEGGQLAKCVIRLKEFGMSTTLLKSISYDTDYEH